MRETAAVLKIESEMVAKSETDRVRAMIEFMRLIVSLSLM